MAEFAKGYSTIGNVSIIGGSGDDGASSVVGGDSAKALRSVFDSVHAATGLDLAGIIQGQAVGRGFGAGLAQSETHHSAAHAGGTAVRATTPATRAAKEDETAE